MARLGLEPAKSLIRTERPCPALYAEALLPPPFEELLQ